MPMYLSQYRHFLLSLLMVQKLILDDLDGNQLSGPQRLAHYYLSKCALTHQI